MKQKTFSLMGERCSGTNWVQLLILKNFNIIETRYPGFKHWPDYRKGRPRNHITIYLIRNSLDWLRSFYNAPHYVRPRAKQMYSFMYKTPFVSMRSKTEVVKQDKNMETDKAYRDLWDMRSAKHLYWLKKSEKYEFYKFKESVSDMSTTLAPLATPAPLATLTPRTSTTEVIETKLGSDIEGKRLWPAIDLWVRYEDVLADPKQFLDFFSERLRLVKTNNEYDLLAHNYKSKIAPNFNQTTHKAKQLFFGLPKDGAIWLKNSMSKPIGILVLTNLLRSPIEKHMNYDVFYQKVLDELVKL